MKTVLIAVLASSGEPYPSLVKTSEATWDSVSVDGVETLFYFDRGFKEKLPRSIVVNESGGLYDIGKRNLLAYLWALDHLQWDFMARINASCFVRKKLLLDFCQTLPDSGLCSGVLCQRPAPAQSFLWGGANYILSRDVVRKFVSNAKLWDHSLMEDVAMSKLALALGIALDIRGRAASINQKDGHWLCLCYNGKIGGFEFHDFSEMRRLDDQHFIRIKQDGHRELEHVVMRELQKTYGD